MDPQGLEALREENFSDIAIPCKVRMRKDSISAPSGIVNSTCGKRRHSRAGVGLVSKRGRNEEDGNEKNTETARQGEMSAYSTENDCGATGADLNGSNGENAVDRIPVSAYIEETRMYIAIEEIRLFYHVEQRISQLLDDAHLLPICEGLGDGNASEDELIEARITFLIELLSAVNDAEHCIKKVKKALLDVMRLEGVRKDTYFRKAILRIFQLCMEPIREPGPVGKILSKAGIT